MTTVPGSSKELWKEVYEKSARRLTVLVERRMPAALRAYTSTQDVVQETFLRGWKGRDDAPSREVWMSYAWLAGIAQLVLYEWTRQATQRRTASLAASSRTSSSHGIEEALVAAITHASERALRDEGVKRMQQILSELDEEAVRLLDWQFLQGLRTATIAERLDISEVAARKRLERARHKAREIATRLETRYGEVSLPWTL